MKMMTIGSGKCHFSLILFILCKLIQCYGIPFDVILRKNSNNN